MGINIQVNIDGMACDGCSSNLQSKLKESAEKLGIVNVQEVSSEKKLALLEVNDSFNPQTVQQFINDAGYEYKNYVPVE